MCAKWEVTNLTLLTKIAIVTVIFNIFLFCKRQCVMRELKNKYILWYLPKYQIYICKYMLKLVEIDEFTQTPFHWLFILLKLQQCQFSSKLKTMGYCNLNIKLPNLFRMIHANFYPNRIKTLEIMDKKQKFPFFCDSRKFLYRHAPIITPSIVHFFYRELLFWPGKFSIFGLKSTQKVIYLR